MKVQKWIQIAAWLGAGAALSVRADVVVYQPKLANNNYHDAFIRNDVPNCTTCSGDAYNYIMNYVGSYLANFAVQFDGLNAYIGGNEAVTSAVLRLQLYITPSTDSNPTPTLDVYTLTQPWANGATWFSNGLGSAWTTAGGTVGATPVASITPPTNPAPYYTSFDWDVTTVVSNWVAGASPDYGFLVKWSAGNTFDRRWYFQGSGIAAAVPSFTGFEPKLTIYTVPEPSAVMMLSLGMLGASILWRGRRQNRQEEGKI